MSLDRDFVESLSEVPICPYCGQNMERHETKTWNKSYKEWIYISVIFQCINHDHVFKVYLRSPRDRDRSTLSWVDEGG